jgi:hypothetical protein
MEGSTQIKLKNKTKKKPTNKQVKNAESKSNRKISINKL